MWSAAIRTQDDPDVEIGNELTLARRHADKGNIAQSGERMPNLADVAHFFDDVAKRIKANDRFALSTAADQDCVDASGTSIRSTPGFAIRWKSKTRRSICSIAIARSI